MASGSGGYLVPAGDAEVEIEVRRSRFLAAVRRVETEEEARALVERARRSHIDARHHCSAFALGAWGAGTSVHRSSDDGEPSGTAGAPMLEVLRGREIGDVAVVVTRWFGGVLLGAGGLVRAYGDAVREGLDAAGTLRRERRLLFDIEIAHSDAGRVESELRGRGFTVVDAGYAATVTLRIGVAPKEVDAFHAAVAASTSGATTPRPTGETWVDG